MGSGLRGQTHCLYEGPVSVNPIWLKAVRNTIFSVTRVTDVARVLKGKFARDFVLTAGSNFSIALFGAVGGILAARILGSEGRGELAAAVVWAGIVQVVVSVGLPQALTYCVADDPAKIGLVLMATLVLLVVQSISALAIGQFALVALLARFQPAAVRSVQVYLFSVPFSLLTTYITTMAQGLKQFDLFNAPRVASSMVYAIALVSAPILGIHGARQVVLVLLGIQIAVALTSLVWFWVRIRPRGHFEWQFARELLRYGLKSYLGNLSWMANARLDQFVMSAFVELQALGYYAVAVSYATVLFPLSGAFAMIVFPNVVGSERSLALDKISRIFKLNLALSGASALVLGLLAPVLLPLLFGTEFYPSVGLARILLGGIVLLGCNYVLSDGLRGMGFPLLPSVAEALGFAVTVGGLLLLLPSLGILGAAWVSVFSYGMAFVVLSLAIRRSINLAKSIL